MIALGFAVLAVFVLVRRGRFHFELRLGRSRELHEPRLIRLLPPAEPKQIAAPEPWPRAPRPHAGGCRWCGSFERRECDIEREINAGRCSRPRYIRPEPTSLPGPGERQSR